MNYIFLTNTNWSEPPRIRHQLAFMLEKNDNKIYFFERPSARHLFSEACISNKYNIELIKNARIFHHRFSIGFLNKIDCLVLNNRLKKFISKNKLDVEDTVIVNFIYDYSVMLKTSFRVFTFINDDFESQTSIKGFNYKRKSIIKNIESSGRLITVSPLLTLKYNAIVCKKWDFLPWVSDDEKECVDKVLYSDHFIPKGIIFYGFINSRLDFDVIEHALYLLPDFNFEFCGEISHSISNKVDYLCSRYKNINFNGPVKFCDINFSKYFCSITPYQGHVSDNVVYATNKLFRLASAGLPSINIGLPGLIEDASVIKVNSADEFIDAIKSVSANRFFYKEAAVNLASEHTETKALKNWLNILHD